MPYTVSGSVVGSLVTSVTYNNLALTTEIALNNGIKTNFGYYGMGGYWDPSGGYYGRLGVIYTAKYPGASPVFQDINYTWDAVGNLTQKSDNVASETENFTYDFLDRLTAVSGAYSHSYSYNQTGNMTAMNSNNYTYGGTKPHAVTTAGSTNYSCDSNGNMTSRGSHNLTWNLENQLTSYNDGSTTTSFVYDGDGKRGKKTVPGVGAVG